MAVSYKKLLHLLVDRDTSLAELQKDAGYSANISTRLRNDEYIALETLEKICLVLDCGLDDIIDFIPSESKAKRKKEN